LTLRLDAWCNGEEPPLAVSVTLDLFQPPVHISNLPGCVAAKQVDPEASLDEIAAKLGLNRMTVKRALKYARLMAEAGLTDPYRELREEPKDASRWKKKLR
jgi:hypothetical protein